MAASPALSAQEEELIKQLVGAGNELLENPPSSKEELLEKLEKLGLLLSNVDQGPSRSFHEALKPSIKALFSDGLLHHADLEVKISTTYCVSEILRITAPVQPCDDKSFEEFFKLAMMAFKKLANVEDCCYSKAVTILQTFAKYRLCVLMLDLELDALTLEMFQLFLNSICPNNVDALLPYMEAIMTMIIEDSEEISVDLLNILLTNAKKENENPLNLSYVLGERVFRNCNAKLKQYLPDAVKSLGIDIKDYAEIVRVAIQRENLENKELAPNSSCPRDVSSSENALPKVLVGDNQTPPRRRGRKPNSLMKPEEGYEHTWIGVEGKSDMTPCQRKEGKKRSAGKESKSRSGRPPKHSVSKGSHFSSDMGEAEILKPTTSQSLNFNCIEDFNPRERNEEEENKPSDGGQLMPVSDSLRTSASGHPSASTVKRSNSGEKSKKRKRKHSPSEKAARKQAEKLVACRIKVWWPIDQTFYEGRIASFDYLEKKHKVNYDDGEVEDLDLSKERWELVRDVKSAVDEQEIVAGVADLSEIKLDHVINSYRSSRRKRKAREVAAELPEANPEVEKRKVSRRKSTSSTSERARDAAELPLVKQEDEKCKSAPPASERAQDVKDEVEKRKVIRIKSTAQMARDAAAESPVGEHEGEKQIKKRRRTKKAAPRFSILDSEKVNVNGYQVKASAAPILEEIFAKHGDIAANCPYPSPGFRASVFEVICDVIRQLRTDDWGTIVSNAGRMKTEVSDTAAAAHLEVSWLKRILDDIPTENESQLASVVKNTELVGKAAWKDLTQRKAELEEARRQLDHAEQSKKEAQRVVEVLEAVKKKAQIDMELNSNKRNAVHNRFYEGSITSFDYFEKESHGAE